MEVKCCETIKARCTPIDLSNVKIVDLSQDWGMNTPGFATYEGPTIKWIKRRAFDRVGGQKIESTMHVGTHIDAPRHFVTHKDDVASIPLDELFGPACIVDLEPFGLEDYDIYTSAHFEQWEKNTGITIQPGDILVIHTGYHKYYPCDASGHMEEDETRYFIKHPGPTREFADWVKKRGVRWMAIDAGSTDHPMNTVIRRVRADLAIEADNFLKGKYGKGLDDFFPNEDYQVTHVDLFKHRIYHLENIGGDIDNVLDKRVWVSSFPWKFVDGEAAWVRFVAYVNAEGCKSCEND